MKFDEQSEVQFCAFKIGAFIDHNNIFGLYHLNEISFFLCYFMKQQNILKYDCVFPFMPQKKKIMKTCLNKHYAKL